MEVCCLVVCADVIRWWFGFIFCRSQGDLSDIGRGVHPSRSVGFFCLTLALIWSGTEMMTYYWILSSSGRLADHMHRCLLKLQGWDPLMVFNTKIQKCILYIPFLDRYIRIAWACVFHIFGVDCGSSWVPASRGIFTGSPYWRQLCVCCGVIWCV